MIPVNPYGLSPRTAPLEGFLDADGLGLDAVDEEPVDEDPVEFEFVVVLAALDYRDWMSVTGEKSRGRRTKCTLKALNVSLAVGLTAKTMPALQWLGRSINAHYRTGIESACAHPPCACLQ